MSDGSPVIEIGVALRYRGTGPANRPSTPHTCVVITNPDSAGDLLIVPICTYHPRADPTCVLEVSVGWAPIRWKSYVGYYLIKRVYLKNLYLQLVHGDLSYIGVTPSSILEQIGRAHV